MVRMSLDRSVRLVVKFKPRKMRRETAPKNMARQGQNRLEMKKFI